jgi:hypothetical protein
VRLLACILEFIIHSFMHACVPAHTVTLACAPHDTIKVSQALVSAHVRVTTAYTGGSSYGRISEGGA